MWDGWGQGFRVRVSAEGIYNEKTDFFLPDFLLRGCIEIYDTLVLFFLGYCWTPHAAQQPPR